MNTQTILNVVKSDLSKECGKAFAQSTAVTAGMLSGVALYSAGSKTLTSFKEKRAAKKAAKNES